MPLQLQSCGLATARNSFGKLPCLLIWLTSFSLVLVSQATAQQDQQVQAGEHPLVPALRLARQSQAILEQITDYECHFLRREMVNNRLIAHQTQLRLRHEPFSVYMKFIDPAPGREVLYVHGKNQGKLIAHEAGGLSALVGTVSLPINSPTVMAEARYPITNTGMKRLIELVIAQWELESGFGETDVKYYPNAKIGNSECEVIEVSHPRPRRQFRYQLTRVFFDKKTRLPIRVENYGFPPSPEQQPILVEEYTYTNIQLNRGFTDADFDRNNPKYSF